MIPQIRNYISVTQAHRLLCFICLTFNFSDSGLSWTSLPTRSLSSAVTFKWQDIEKSCLFSQQTTRDSKRRASKEAGALSKDGQLVNLNSSGDPEPMECVWWKMETRAKSLWRRGRWPGAVSCSPEDGMVIYRKVRGWCFASGHRSHSIYNISTCICLRPKILGCCIFVVPLPMHVWSREGLTTSVCALRHAFLPCLWCWSGNVSLW